MIFLPNWTVDQTSVCIFIELMATHRRLGSLYKDTMRLQGCQGLL